jgi:hypothetical protein
MVAKTIPIAFSFEPRDNDDVLIYAFREAVSNAVNYQAKSCHGIVIRHDGEDYLMVAHDGTPFKDEREILEYGCTPNVSARAGNAFQGSGLTYTAAISSPNSILIIGSKTDSEWIFACGKPDRKENVWKTEGCPEWQGIVETLFPTALEKYNVIYLFKIALKDHKDKTYLNERLATRLSFSTDTKNLLIHYCPKQIGHEAYESDSGYLVYSPKSVAYDNRDIVSRETFVTRYSEENKPVLHFVNATCRDGDFEFTFSGTVSPILYEGTISGAQGKKKDYDWLVSKRYTTGHKIGSSTGFKAPHTKGYLIFSAMAQPDKDCFERFTNNAVYATNRVNPLFDMLGLDMYDPKESGGGRNPFATIEINITDLHSVKRRGEADGGKQQLTCMTEQESFFRRKADFTFGNTDLCRAMMEAACEAAACNVPEDFKKECAVLFPPRDMKGQYLSINLQGYTTQNSRKSPVDVWDIETGEMFGKQFECEERKFLVLYHRDTKRYLTNANVSIANGSRGFKIKNADYEDLSPQSKSNIAALCAHHSIAKEDFHAVIVDIGKMENSDGVAITSSEYVYGDLPSRNIKLNSNTETISLGIVLEVPKRIQNHSEVPTGKTTSAGTSNQQPYIKREDYILGRYHDKKTMWLFNTEHPFTKRYFKTQPGIIQNSKQHKKVTELYIIFNSYAESYYKAAKDCGKSKDATIDLPEGYNKDEVHDAHLNFIFNRMIENRPRYLAYILQYLDQENASLKDDSPPVDDPDM